MGHMAAGMIGHGDPYSNYGYTYDSQQHARHEILRQTLPQQGYWNGDTYIQNTEQLARYYAASDALKTSRGQIAGEGDHGANNSYLARASDSSPNSDWPRRSNSSALPTPAHASYERYGPTMSPGEDPALETAKTSPQSIYLKQERPDYPPPLREAVPYGLQNIQDLDFVTPTDPDIISQKDIGADYDNGVVREVDGGLGM